MKNTVLQYENVLSKEELIEKIKQDLPQYKVKNGWFKFFQVRKDTFTYCSVDIKVIPKTNQIHLNTMQDKGFFLWFFATGLLAFFIMSKKRKAFAEKMKSEVKECMDRYHNIETQKIAE